MQKLVNGNGPEPMKQIFLGVGLEVAFCEELGRNASSVEHSMRVRSM